MGKLLYFLEFMYWFNALSLALNFYAYKKLGNRSNLVGTWIGITCCILLLVTIKVLE